jgi:hypothetical protein
LNRKNHAGAEPYLNGTRKKTLLFLVRKSKDGNIENIAHD